MIDFHNDLDAEFPLDALPDDDRLPETDKADVDALVICPYCGEPNDIVLDPGSGSTQDYVEDCQVCCRPWRVLVRYDASGGASLEVTPENPE